MRRWSGSLGGRLSSMMINIHVHKETREGKSANAESPSLLLVTALRLGRKEEAARELEP